MNDLKRFNGISARILLIAVFLLSFVVRIHQPCSRRTGQCTWRALHVDERSQRKRGISLYPFGGWHALFSGILSHGRYGQWCEPRLTKFRGSHSE